MTDDNRVDDNMLNDAESKVLHVIGLFNRPVTTREIAAEMNITMAQTVLIFKRLVEKGNLVVYSSEQGKTKYYAPAASKSGLDAVLSQKYADIAGALERQYNELKDRNDKLENRVEKLYANVITLMGIFVAIFALIVININAVEGYIEKMPDIKKAFEALILLNTPLVIAIVVLVLLIKFIIISPNKKK